MSEVQFDEESGLPLRYGYVNRIKPTEPLTQGPLFYRTLMKLGIAKNAKQASRITLGFTIVCFALSVVIFFVRTRSISTVRYYITPDVLVRLPPEVQAQIKQSQFEYPALR